MVTTYLQAAFLAILHENALVWWINTGADEADNVVIL